jgi:DNA-binding NarL/FixJ family response regulator
VGDGPAESTVVTRVMLADGQRLFRQGLHRLLEGESGVRVVGEAADAEEAVKVALEYQPDVVLIDVKLPGGGDGRAPGETGVPDAANSADGRAGLAAIRHLAASGVAAVVLTDSEASNDLYEAVKAGASGYLLKDSSISDVADALRSVCRGQSPISPSMASKLLSQFTILSERADARPAPGHAELTDRELEVLRLVARGLSNRRVAEELFISENTVKNHVRNILEKLRLHSRVQAAMFAVREQLIEPDNP